MGNVKIRNNDNLSILIKRLPNPLILFITGLWGLFWLAIMSTLVYGLITDPDKIDAGFIIFISFFTLSALFVVKTFFWHLRGKEMIEIKDNYLSIKKLGTFFTFDRRYELEQIDNFRLIDKNPSPYFLKLYGITGGIIQFGYYGNKKHFGQTLENQKAQEIVDLLNAKLAQSIFPEQNI